MFPTLSFGANFWSTRTALRRIPGSVDSIRIDSIRIVFDIDLPRLTLRRRGSVREVSAIEKAVKVQCGAFPHTNDSPWRRPICLSRQLPKMTVSQQCECCLDVLCFTHGVRSMGVRVHGCQLREQLTRRGLLHVEMLEIAGCIRELERLGGLPLRSW